MTKSIAFTLLGNARIYRLILSIPVALLMLAAILIDIAPAAADSTFDDGIKAYRERDFLHAFRILEPLAVQGNIEAAFLVGSMHELGQGTVQSYAQAEVFLKKSAEAGNSEAQVRLAFLYADGHLGIDHGKDAADWFERAARLGNSTAQANLGVIFANGIGRIQSRVLGHMWANIAVANGNDKAADVREKIQESMDKKLIIEAQELARKCLSSNYVECNH